MTPIHDQLAAIEARAAKAGKKQLSANAFSVIRCDVPRLLRLARAQDEALREARTKLEQIQRQSTCPEIRDLAVAALAALTPAAPQ